MYIITHIQCGKSSSSTIRKYAPFLSPAQRTPDPQKGVSKGNESHFLRPLPPATKPKPSRTTPNSVSASNREHKPNQGTDPRQSSTSTETLAPPPDAPTPPHPSVRERALALDVACESSIRESRTSQPAPHPHIPRQPASEQPLVGKHHAQVHVENIICPPAVPPYFCENGFIYRGGHIIEVVYSVQRQHNYNQFSIIILLW